MLVRGLKTKIAINITLLLLLGMFSINWVTMITAKRNLIQSEIARGRLFASLLEEELKRVPIWEHPERYAGERAVLSQHLKEAGISCLAILADDHRQVVFGARECTLPDDLAACARRAMESGRKEDTYTGSSWGVFGPRRHQAVISAPLVVEGRAVAGFSLAMPLDRVHRELGRSQRFLWVYLFLNTAILGFLGIYRVFKLYLQPVSRLAQRAEEYKNETDEIVFSVRKEDNELNRLSNALNGMLRRISADREKLRATVSSLERANAELKRAQKEIVRAEKLASVGRLSAGIAHEIGNPIGIVLGYLELLKQGDVEAGERLEYIRRAENEIERINRIIRQLLEVSRPSPSAMQTVRVHEIVDDLAELLHLQPLTAHIDLELALSAGEDRVVADPDQLRQVFLNLIINAADATRSHSGDGKGRLRVTTALKPDEGDGRGSIEICFADNGPGIPEASLECIFDPFFTTKEPGKGTGLGLSVSYMIIEGFGGKISARSEVGVGTTLMISLPVCEDPSGDAHARRPASEPSRIEV
jgi:signal transduction histidine kinase